MKTKFEKNDNSFKSNKFEVLDLKQMKSIIGGGEYAIIKNEKGEWELHWYPG